MARPPRDPHAAILSTQFLRAITFHGTTIALVSLATFWWARSAWPEGATTMAFMTLALAQIFHLGNARGAQPVLAFAQAFRNPWAVGAVALSLALQVAAVTVEPLAGVLGVAPLGTREWMVVAGLGLVPAVIGQAVKAVAAR
jgi:Ca2+-transporting ATPase